MHSRIAVAALSVVAVGHGQSFTWRRAAIHELGTCQMAFDSDRNLLIAFNGTHLEWDGDRWVRRDITTPQPVASDFRLAYDDNRHRLVLLLSSSGGGISVREFDGNAWTYMVPTNSVLPSSRRATAVAYDPVRQMVVVAGGIGFSANVGDTWGWNGATWTQLSTSGPGDHGNCAMAFHPPTGRLVLIGGEVRGNETWTFDGQQWVQQFPATSPPAFTDHRLTTDPNLGLVWLLDGPSGATWSWDGSNWTQAATCPTTRLQFGFAADSRGCLAAGGLRTFTNPASGAPTDRPVGDTWQLRNHQWTELDPGGPFLGSTTIAYDEHRGRLVALDTTSLVALRTLEWDGRRWFDTGRTLDPIFETTACFDPFRSRTLVFGGLDFRRSPLQMAVNDLRSWDGTRWTTLAGPVVPPGRARTAMAFDLLRGEVVMYGGFNLIYLDDTWIWNGSIWRQASTPSPGARYFHAMTYDPQSGGVLMFGGVVSGIDTNDTWLWNGVAWNQLRPASQPSARHSHQLISSTVAPLPTLVGGVANGLRSDRWQWINGDWQQLPESLPTLTTTVFAAKCAIDNLGNTLYLAEGSTFVGGPSVATTGDLGAGCIVGTVPSLRAIGDPVLGNAGFSIELDGAAPGVPYVLGAGVGIGAQPIGNCTLYLPNIDGTIGGLTSNSGAAVSRLPVPAEAALLGLTFSLQAATPDPSTALGFALSNGLFGRIGR